MDEFLTKFQNAIFEGLYYTALSVTKVKKMKTGSRDTTDGSPESFWLSARWSISCRIKFTWVSSKSF